MCKRLNEKPQTSKEGFDKCLTPFIKLLNSSGIETKYSCCGHFATNPDIILPNRKSLVKLIKFLKDDYLDWINSIENIGGKTFKIIFEALVCTPPQYPSWVDNKDEVKHQKKLRKDIGL